MLVLLSIYFCSLIQYLEKCIKGLRAELDAKDYEIKNKNIQLRFLLDKYEKLKEA